MTIRKPTRVLGAAVILAGLPLAAIAQTTEPTTPAQPERPPAMTPTTPSTTPSTTPAMPDRSATAPDNKVNPLVGLAVFSSDGNKLGNVHSVNAEPDGKVKAIHIKTGGFLGFGAKLVAIPENKFTRAGENIQLGMTADEVSKLPEVKEQS